MYYRIAIQSTSAPGWRWVSAPLASLNTVMQWMRVYSSIPRDRLRIVSAASRVTLSEQMLRENEGLMLASMPATGLLAANREGSHEVGEVSRNATTTTFPTHARDGNHQLAKVLDPTSSRVLDARREALERGAGGDHDRPYRFSLPLAAPEIRAWVTLLAQAQYGDLRAEVAAVVGAGCSAGETDGAGAHSLPNHVGGTVTHR